MRSGLSRDPYGFSFWLKWILGFAISFVAVACFWTAVIMACLGSFTAPEVSTTWAVAVFGSWFLLLTLFIRKKEQIWKRLNDDQERATNLWFWALMSLVLGFVVSALFWTWFLRDAVILSANRFDGTPICWRML